VEARALVEAHRPAQVDADHAQRLLAGEQARHELLPDEAVEAGDRDDSGCAHAMSAPGARARLAARMVLG
jgi:hypothetical protein